MTDMDDDDDYDGDDGVGDYRYVRRPLLSDTARDEGGGVYPANRPERMVEGFTAAASVQVRAPGMA